MLMQDRNSYQTATEFTTRQQQNQTIWSKDYGKIVNFAKNILLSVCDIGLSSGDIVLPDQLAVFNGTYDLDYFGVQLESPISKMYNVQEVEGLINATQVLGALSPELINSAIDLQAVPNWLFNKIGVDHELLRNREERELFEEQASAAAEQLSGAANMLQFTSAWRWDETFFPAHAAISSEVRKRGKQSHGEISPRKCAIELPHHARQENIESIGRSDAAQ
jgi:hypothetical protein